MEENLTKARDLCWTARCARAHGLPTMQQADGVPKKFMSFKHFPSLILFDILKVTKIYKFKIDDKMSKYYHITTKMIIQSIIIFWLCFGPLKFKNYSILIQVARIDYIVRQRSKRSAMSILFDIWHDTSEFQKFVCFFFQLKLKPRILDAPYTIFLCVLTPQTISPQIWCTVRPPLCNFVYLEQTCLRCRCRPIQLRFRSSHPTTEPRSSKPHEQKLVMSRSGEPRHIMLWHVTWAKTHQKFLIETISKYTGQVLKILRLKLDIVKGVELNLNFVT